MTLLATDVGPLVSNAPAIGIELPLNVSRSRVDLTGFTQARLQYSVDQASALISMRIEYSTDSGTSWQATPLVAAVTAVATANANSAGSFVALPGGVGDVLVRAVIAGNGMLDPRVRYVRLDLH